MGYLVGIFAGFILAAIVGNGVLHDWGAGFFPGLALALWIGNALNHDEREERLNRLFPRPVKYPMPPKEAFSKVSKTIREFTYEYGKSFQIKTRDTKKGEIKADLRWTDFDETPDPSQHDMFRVKREQVDRHVRLEVYFNYSVSDSTVITLEWYPDAEGMNPHACDPVISAMNARLETALGPGEADAPKKERWIPPLWLHATTAVCIALYILAGLNSFGPAFARIGKEYKDKEQVKQDYRVRIDKLKDDWEQFKRFKDTYVPPSAGTNNFGADESIKKAYNVESSQGGEQ